MSTPTVSVSRQSKTRRPYPSAEYISGATSKSIRFVDSISVPFEECAPVRAFRSWPGKRNYSGVYWSSTTRSHIGFESLFERTALMTLDRDPSITAISSQPMWIHWSDGEKARAHAPDFFARHSNGDGEVIDVRPTALVDSVAAEIFTTTRELCEDAGFRYRVISDLGRVLDDNLRFITPYRDARWELPPDIREAMFDAVPELPLQALAAAIQGSNGRKGAIGHVYWLIWHGHIDVDLTRPLTSRTLARPKRGAAR